MDVNSAAWRKSSYSGGNGGGCVEVALAEEDIAVRDSKDPKGPCLQFSADDWHAFLTRIKELPSAETLTARHRLGRCRATLVLGGRGVGATSSSHPPARHTTPGLRCAESGL